MITANQQQIIESITNEFIKLNDIESKPMSQLAQQIKGQIADFDTKQQTFIEQTKAFEKANKILFEEVCLQVEELCNEIGLHFKADIGYKNGIFTDTRKITIVFPQFIDNTRFDGQVDFCLYASPITTDRYSTRGIEMIGLAFKESLLTEKYYKHNVLDFIAEKIVKIHKQYSK